MMETYYGHVRTPADAIKLFEACRLGLLPRVQRRLSEKERQSIRSGSVFVWDEREAGMRRWTDGKSWSASRVSGSFLTYREMEGKRGGGTFVPTARRTTGKTPDSGRGSDEDDPDGDGPDGYRYKPDGLMKQSFSITASTGQHLHLISYYSRPTNGQELTQPTHDPALRHIVPVKGMYPESTVHEQSPGTATTRAPMQSAPGYAPQPPVSQPMHNSPLQGNRPPYSYQVPQGYNNWPPSPVSTPPYNYIVYNPSAPPPNAAPTSTHSSPHQYASLHHQVPSSGPQQPTAFDRPPPPLHETSLPPPPPPTLLQRAVTAAGPQPSMPIYAPNPSPRVAQSRLVAEQQAQQAAQLALQHAQGSQMPPLDGRASGTVSVTSLMSGPPPTPNGTITSRSANTPPLPRPQTPGHSSLNASPASDGPRPDFKLPAAGPSIPSISSLVNSRDSAADNRSTGSAAGSRSGSKSPKGDGPKDIPHDKLNFGEDMRALSVLNRKFCL